MLAMSLRNCKAAARPLPDQAHLTTLMPTEGYLGKTPLDGIHPPPCACL